ncbi:MAG: diguanylate cyclase, partial [Clostridia bacterium]
MIFLIRAVVWVGCALYALQTPHDEIIWAGVAVVVLGGGLGARIWNYSAVNRLLILVDWAAITAAVHIAQSASPVFVLYAAEAVVLTVYGAFAYCAGAAFLFSASLIAARWPYIGQIQEFEAFMLFVVLLSAGLTGEAYARQQRSLARNRRRVSELAGLQAIQETLIQEQPLEVQMAALLTRSLEMLAIEVGYIGLIDDSGQVQATAMIGLRDELQGWRWDPNTSEPTGTVLHSHKPLIITEPDYLARTGLGPDGVRTLVVAPLFDQSQPLGVLGLGSRRAQAFGEEILHVVETVASLAVGRIRFDRERSAARSRARLLASLERVGRLLNSNLKMEVLLPTIHSSVAEELQPDAFFVVLMIPDDPSHVLMPYMYDEGKVYGPEILDITAGPTSQVLRDGEPRIFRGDVPGAKPVGSERSPLGWMVAPLKHEGRMIGAISAQSYRMFYSQPHLDYLASIANQAAVAIENARLYQENELVAMTDPLTGLGNARQFAFVLDHYLHIALEDPNGSLALLMIDSDSLKRINDRYGHQAGDQHIRHLASAIRGNIRSEDVACRYAGDEFVVLLPNTPVRAAEQVAERIRRAVAAGFRWESELVEQSVSIGVAA